MQRPRFLAPLGLIAIALATGPLLAAVALAADPTVVVRPGDTLTGIAKRHGIAISDLVALNGITDPNRIYAGQTLRVGTDPSVPAPAPAVAPIPAAAPVAAATVHVVQRGENLTVIARRYGVSIAALVTANGIAHPSRIYAGQQLTIPGAAAVPAPDMPASPPPPAPSVAPVAAPAPAPAATVHVVQRGENLTVIARRYGVSIAALVTANGIADAGRIYAGQQLAIPATATAPAPVAAPAAPAPAMPASMSSLVASRASVGQVIVEEATALGVPAPLALALAWQESGWQQGVVSHAGAVGVMQLLPATADWVGQVMLGAPVDINDTRHNVRAGVRLLGHYLVRYGGDRELALAAYYQGQRSADLYGIYSISRPYIASILLLERLFGG